MSKKLMVKLEWNDEVLGPCWMNLDNLKLCLFSKQHTKPELLSVEVLKNKKIDYTKKSKGVIAREFGVSYSLVHALEDRLRDEFHKKEASEI